jgi:hypothetical protein
MNYEEEIQKRVEEGRMGGTADEMAYKQVFSALKQEPEISISPMFANRVVSKLKVEKSGNTYGLEFLLVITGIIVFTGGGIYTILATGFKPEFGFLRAISDYKGVFLFGLLFIAFINLLDKRLTGKKEVI